MWVKYCNFSSNQNTGILTQWVDIKNSIFNSNQIGIFSQGGSSTITNCTINYNIIIGVKLYVGTNTLENCEIKYNGIGISDYAYQSGNVFTMNVVESNNIGIKIEGNLYNPTRNIYCNKICNNTAYDFYNNATWAISIPQNYWCTADSLSTTALIYDGYDNVNLGLVTFMPIDTSQCYLTGCALIVTATVTNATCDTCHNGSATGQVTNGFPPYTWTWYTSPMQSTQTATGLAPGTYTLCVTDGHGCTSCNNSIFVDSTNCTGFSINAFATNATCSSCNDGTAWVNVIGGTPPYAYTWYTIPMQNTNTATGLSQGTYNVCVTDLYGCTVCDSVTVSTGNCSAYFYLYPDTTTLHHYYAVNMASGVLPFTYLWNWGDGTFDTTAYPSHTYSTAGFYTICLTITDSAGCTNMYCDSFYLQKNTNTIITVNVIPNTVTGIQENYNNSFFIFPNPASDYFSLVLPANNLNTELRIFNILGEEKYFSALKNQKTDIDISGFARGIYIIEVNSGNKIIRKKIVKQ